MSFSTVTYVQKTSHLTPCLTATSVPERQKQQNHPRVACCLTRGTI